MFLERCLGECVQGVVSEFFPFKYAAGTWIEICVWYEGNWKSAAEIWLQIEKNTTSVTLCAWTFIITELYKNLLFFLPFVK